MLGRKQRSRVARSFPNRYLFGLCDKVTSLFSTSCILDIILQGNYIGYYGWSGVEFTNRFAPRPTLSI